MLYEVVRIGEVYYDEARRFVVLAKSKEEARILCAKMCGDEGERVWIDEEYSKCRVLSDEGESRVVIRDFRNG